MYILKRCFPQTALRTFPGTTDVMIICDGEAWPFTSSGSGSGSCCDRNSKGEGGADVSGFGETKGSSEEMGAAAGQVGRRGGGPLLPSDTPRTSSNNRSALQEWAAFRARYPDKLFHFVAIGLSLSPSASDSSSAAATAGRHSA